VLMSVQPFRRAQSAASSWQAKFEVKWLRRMSGLPASGVLGMGMLLHVVQQGAIEKLHNMQHCMRQ
jgi:hypothetical protein